jgi:hypothetical protein
MRHPDQLEHPLEPGQSIKLVKAAGDDWGFRQLLGLACLFLTSLLFFFALSAVK